MARTVTLAERGVAAAICTVIACVALASPVGAQILWNFDEGAVQSSLPSGWTKQVEHGDWVLQGDSSTTLGDDGVLSALFSPPSDSALPATRTPDPNVAEGNGTDPQIQIDAISPEFKITDLNSAGIQFVMGTLLDNSNFGVQTDRIVLHLLDANPLATPLFLWECGFVDAGVCNPNGAVGPITLHDKGAAEERLYRLRVRVEDNDIDLTSFQHLELDDLTISGAVVASLPGDFNTDGEVDAADYTVWRDGLGSLYQSSDYEVWRTNYGLSSAATRLLPNTAPEPCASLAAAVALIGLNYSGRVRATRNPNERLPRS